MTGTTGFVGGRIARKLSAEGWEVVGLGRTASPLFETIPFRLGDDIPPDRLAGFSTLVHCAYDFGAISHEDIVAVNVRGSERLLRSARRAGVESVVFISSISAFDGCRSLYGQAKLELEGIVRSIDGWVLRPGLVWGERPGGLFGRLVQSVRMTPIVPLPAGGPQRQYLVHDVDVGEAVLRCAGRAAGPDAKPVTIAHARPWHLRDLVREIARALDRRPVLLPVPWEVVRFGLRVGEALRLPLRFHADNLVSFVHQNPNPVFNALEALGVQCRELALDRAVLGDRASQGMDR
jgi:nucleoside-diphosphate-sugar epimerase